MKRSCALMSKPDSQSTTQEVAHRRRDLTVHTQEHPSRKPHRPRMKIFMVDGVGIKGRLELAEKAKQTDRVLEMMVLLRAQTQHPLVDECASASRPLRP